MKTMKKRKGKKSYTVGYKKPPVESQFQKGTSGNPEGREKRPSNYFEAFAAVLRETVDINENGVRRRVTKPQAIWIRVTNAAANGDKKARAILAQFEEIRAKGAKYRPRVSLRYVND